ncbi:MAG TPA: hypothetical protein VEY10_10400 [Flavisolibacter sp.]|nr:hypothetical protein [Flavisolibacter sp.]
MSCSKLFFACLILTFLSCSGDKDNNDVTTSVNKNGAVETSILVGDLDDTTNILTTTHKVWVRDTIYKTIEYRDTLPSLGTTLTTAENSDGNKQTVPVKKEYEIYITIK